MSSIHSTRHGAAWAALVVLGCLRAAPADTASEVLDATGVQGGFVVHLGCGDGKQTAALKSSAAALPLRTKPWAG